MTSQVAEAYGIKPLKPNKQGLAPGLHTLLEDPHREQKLASFERKHNLPSLTSSPQAPYPREARYLVMTTGAHLLPETAEKISPQLWYTLLSGLN